MDIYIDTSILVDFFEMTTASTQELEVLLAAIDNGKATLWLPEHTRREFWKNRGRRINKHIDDFGRHEPLPKAPLLVREDEGFKELSDRSRELKKLRDTIVAKVKESVAKEETFADEMIRNLFGKARVIDTDDRTIFDEALRRAQSQLPPGKKDDLGDRLNWVGLLHSLPKPTALNVVSKDSDYLCEGTSNRVHPYLAKEWKKKNGGALRVWIRISEFLDAKFPGVKNATGIERGIAVEQLLDSGSFAATHAAIRRLKAFDSFTEQDVVELVAALLGNSQVHGIGTDWDVQGFYRGLMNKHRKFLDAEIWEEVEEMLSD